MPNPDPFYRYVWFTLGLAAIISPLLVLVFLMMVKMPEGTAKLEENRMEREAAIQQCFEQLHQSELN